MSKIYLSEEIVCATCVFWDGARKPHKKGEGAKVDGENAKGKCRPPYAVSNRGVGQETCAGHRCARYKKWNGK